jgi:hypothetical protein
LYFFITILRICFGVTVSGSGQGIHPFPFYFFPTTIKVFKKDRTSLRRYTIILKLSRREGKFEFDKWFRNSYQVILKGIDEPPLCCPFAAKENIIKFLLQVIPG